MSVDWYKLTMALRKVFLVNSIFSGFSIQNETATCQFHLAIVKVCGVSD